MEDLLLSNPQIQDAAVIGIPDPIAGELPRAFVVPKLKGTISEKDVYQCLEDKVAPYKQLKGGVEFVEILPRSPSGKILRRLLKEQFNSRVASKI